MVTYLLANVAIALRVMSGAEGGTEFATLVDRVSDVDEPNEPNEPGESISTGKNPGHVSCFKNGLASRLITRSVMATYLLQYRNNSR